MTASSACHDPPYHQQHFSKRHADSVFALAESSSQLGRQVASAVSVLQQVVADYGSDHLAISFNGGKDCTVLVHLLLAVLWRADPACATSIPTLYVRCPSPFPQLEEFIHQAANFYNLDLRTITKDMRSALAEYKEERPGVEAVVIGTRRTDPHGSKLHDCDRTDVDKGWPDFMRVHPILDWSYHDVWSFLRCQDLFDGGVPYCVLYDYGYTSLGSTHDTFPNPSLRSEDEQSLWKPAWQLEDEAQERNGRQAPAPPPHLMPKVPPTTNGNF